MIEKKQYIFIDTTKEESIKIGEKEKTFLENKGFNLIKTKQYALNKFCLIYKK